MQGGWSWRFLLALLLLAGAIHAQDEESGSGSGEAAEEGEAAEDYSGDGEAGSGDGEASAAGGGEEEDSGNGDEDMEEECETEDGDSGSGSGDDLDSILALGNTKCKPKSSSGDSADGSGSGEDEEDEVSGADALAAAVGDTCDKEGMDEKVAECMSGLEEKVNTLMTAIMGPEGGNGTLEDQITLVLVKKGVISCESEDQCDDNKQCLKQPDGMSRCQNPCERPEIIRCDVPFSECVTEDHKPMCVCKEEFHGNGTDVCIPVGFNTEENKRGYRMFDEEYVEWENATEKCAELGARLPVLSDKQTMDIVKKYLEEAEFEVFEQWDRSSRRVWLGLQYSPGAGLVWADGHSVVSYPATSRLFVWESRRLLSVESTYASGSDGRHYGLYIDGDIAKLPGGGRKGAAVLCELIPDQLAQDPSKQQQPQQQQQQYDPYNSNRDSRYPDNNRRYPAYPRDNDGGYPNYPSGRR